MSEVPLYAPRAVRVLTEEGVLVAEQGFLVHTEPPTPHVGIWALRVPKEARL